MLLCLVLKWHLALREQCFDWYRFRFVQAIFEHNHHLRSKPLPDCFWAASQVESASDELPLSRDPCELDDMDLSKCGDAPVYDGLLRLWA